MCRNFQNFETQKIEVTPYSYSVLDADVEFVGRISRWRSVAQIRSKYGAKPLKKWLKLNFDFGSEFVVKNWTIFPQFGCESIAKNFCSSKKRHDKYEKFFEISKISKIELTTYSQFWTLFWGWSYPQYTE